MDYKQILAIGISIALFIGVFGYFANEEVKINSDQKMFCDWNYDKPYRISGKTYYPVKCLDSEGNVLVE